MSRSFGKLLGLIALATLLLTAGGGRAADGRPAKDIARWLNELADRVPRVREEARRHLLDIDRDDLDALREAMAQNPQVARPREDLLHDIVDQVFLAGEPYEFNKTAFLGVSYPNPLANPEVSPYAGAGVDHFVVGLCASKYFEVGDLILAIGFKGKTQAVNDWTELRPILLTLAAGQKVTFTVLRRGRMIDLHVILGGQPPQITVDPSLDEFQANRQAIADAYWSERFAPLFGDRTARAAVTP